LFYSLEGLGQGVWGLRNYLNSTPKASDLSDLGDDAPSVVKQDTYRILRDTTLARKLKKLHEDTCQLCSTQVKLRADTTYSEAHHIIPLGQPHFGPDTAENMIVLCPNCHVLCDYGAIELSLNTISMRAAHSVSSESVTYHNKPIWGGDL
jgi:predicted restriction endonuclease